MDSINLECDFKPKNKNIKEYASYKTIILIENDILKELKIKSYNLNSLNYYNFFFIINPIQTH